MSLSPVCPVRLHLSSVADVRFADPGSLKSWFGEARAPRSAVKSAPERSPPTEKAPTRPARPEAAPYSFVQFGHFWYVTDHDGRRVSDPLKTPEVAQQVARRMTEDGDKTPHEPKS